MFMPRYRVFSFPLRSLESPDFDDLLQEENVDVFGEEKVLVRQEVAAPHARAEPFLLGRAAAFGVVLLGMAKLCLESFSPVFSIFFLLILFKKCQDRDISSLPARQS